MEITINNETDASIDEVWTKPLNQQDWGQNILSSELAQGESVVVFLSKGIYDFKFIFSDFTTASLYAADLTLVETYTITLDMGQEG